MSTIKAILCVYKSIFQVQNLLMEESKDQCIGSSDPRQGHNASGPVNTLHCLVTHQTKECSLMPADRHQVRPQLTQPERIQQGRANFNWKGLLILIGSIALWIINNIQDRLIAILNTWPETKWREWSCASRSMCVDSRVKRPKLSCGRSTSKLWMSWPLLLAFAIAMASPTSAMPSGKALLVKSHDYSVGLVVLVFSFFLRHRAVSLAALVFTSSSTWLILAYAEPASQPIEATFRSADATTAFVIWACSTLSFIVSHCIDLARPRPFETFRSSFRAQDEYLLRVIVAVMLEFVALLVKQQESLTLKLTLIWLPTFLSIAVLILAAWDGGSVRSGRSTMGRETSAGPAEGDARRSCPVQLELELGGDG